MAALAVATNLTIATVIATTFETPEVAMVVVDVVDTEEEEMVVINTTAPLLHDHRLVGSHLHQAVRALEEVHHLQCLLMDGNFLLVNLEVKWVISNSLRHLRQIIITSHINRMGGIRTTGEAEAAINIDTT